MTTERLPSPKAGAACNPIDFVSAAGSVQVVQNLISRLKLNLIDFLMHNIFVRAADFVGRRRLRRPKSEGNRGNRGVVDELGGAN